ncbi:MAG: sodium-translocating pyrophosphatase, partial [Polyangia bacterium]
MAAKAWSTFGKKLGSLLVVLATLCGARVAHAAEAHGEMALRLPDFRTLSVLGTTGWMLLASGLVVCVLGMIFGLVIFKQVQGLPVHRSMLEVSELIYETCKTYLITQAKFIMFLEIFIGAIIVVYFYFLQHLSLFEVAIILGFSLIGI